MDAIRYDKLVRDNIPQIIQDSGKQCVCRMLSHDEYLKRLDLKLQEELDEFLCEHKFEELADLLEVIYAVGAARGCSAQELEKMRAQKALTNGAFHKQLLLEEVRG